MECPGGVFPTICQQEKEEIQALDVNNQTQNGYLKIYPRHQCILLENTYQFICDRIKSTAKDCSGVAFMHSDSINSIDAWIFRSSHLPLFLTFITDDAPEAASVKHNNYRASLTAQDLKTKTDVDFKLNHGVVDRETSSCAEKFKLRLCEIESCETRDTGQHCFSIHRENFVEIVKSFIDTVHVMEANSVSETQRAQEKKSLVKCLVISSKKQEKALRDHVEFLQKGGFQVNQMECRDTNALMSLDMTAYNRLDLLVDSDLCSVLKSGCRLKDAINKTFSDLEKQKTEIVLFNLFPPEDNGDDFNELFFDVPRKARKRPQESLYHDRLLPEEKLKNAGKSSVKLVQVGYKNKATINPTSKQAVLVYQRGKNSVLHIVTPNEQSQMKISTITNPDRPDVEEKIITVMIKQTEDKQTVIPGVSSCAIEKGSIVIKLELEPGQIVTEQWLTTVLKVLFTDEVCALLPDDVCLDLDIDATMVVKGEDVSTLAQKSGVHSDCASKFEFEELQHINERLKKTNQDIKAKQIELQHENERLKQTIKDKNAQNSDAHLRSAIKSKQWTLELQAIERRLNRTIQSMEDDQIELQHRYERLKDTIEAKNEKLISDKTKRIEVTTSTGQEVDIFDVPFWVDEKWNVNRSPMSAQFPRAQFTSAREYKILELQDIKRKLNNTIFSMEESAVTRDYYPYTDLTEFTPQVLHRLGDPMRSFSGYDSELISKKKKRIAETTSFGQRVGEDIGLMSSSSKSDPDEDIGLKRSSSKSVIDSRDWTQPFDESASCEAVRGYSDD